VTFVVGVGPTGRPKGDSGADEAGETTSTSPLLAREADLKIAPDFHS
jgi:hypothetical protein